MKFEIPPLEVSNLVPFSPPCSSHPTSAGVCKNGLYMWLVSDASINLYRTENSQWIGGYNFGESLKDPCAKIIAVTEICSSHFPFPCLLIALNSDDASVICLYDINVSKVARAVFIPERAATIEVISGNGGACLDTVHLYVQLRYLFGIIAIGTTSGYIYFLDLCLDEDFSCAENNADVTFMVKKYQLLPEVRRKAISKKQHIFMVLNDQSVRNGSFEFESRSSSLGDFPFGEVCVTALKYIPRTVSLAVGFNFGGIQLWDLKNLCLLYTVANQPQASPIVAFAFQEPENDPRHFCYLWIIRGSLSDERPEDFSVATMYSLVYSKRTYVESFGNLYSDLRNCFKRFEYRLTSDPFYAAQSSNAVGSSLLSCQTISQTDDFHSLDVILSNDSETAPENMSLCFLSWAVWSHSEKTPTSYHLALFDLNQWYRAEMPSSAIRSDPSDLNPYFAHFSLEEVAQIFDLNTLLGIQALPHSIKKFKFITPSEEFFFPSALDYQAIVYSSNGICRTTFMGVQKRLLYEFADIGPSVLVNPKDFYSNLVRCGLVSEPHHTSDRVPLIVQRETFMQLALEHHMPFFFMKCLKEWRYADSIQEGCTSRALLNWSWKKVIQIKSSIDKLVIPLFNCSGSDIDKAPLKCLYSYRRQLNLIDTIFMGYQKFAAPRTEQGIQELKCKKDVVCFINMYLQVILWLHSVRVLPEVSEGDETERNMLYPINALRDSYSKRRNLLQNIHSSIGSTDMLLIDGLIKEIFAENTWQEKGGIGIYPPPSIYAALSCYLLNDVPLEMKHSLMFYLLLDVCDAPQNSKSPLVSEVKKFPSAFGMSDSVAKLVEGFWHLDQFNFEVAIKEMLHPAVKPSDILSWQHCRAIKLLLFQGEARKALKYINRMNPPENSMEDMKLHLSVLLARGAIIQAFDYQRSKQSAGCGTELLNHLFRGSQELHKLKDLMYMPLNSFESSNLVKFLSENEDPRAQEALVMYHLLHCNYYEAAKVNDRLSVSAKGKSASAQERATGRDALVEAFLASVPKTEKKLVDEICRFPQISVKRAEALKPLSLSIKSIPIKQVSYSDILNSLISEASSAMCAPYLDPQTPLKSANKPCFENLPFLRPPLTPEPTKLPSESINTTPVSKRTFTSTSSDFSPPSKRSRLLDNAPFKTPLSGKKNIPKHLVGDVASLLQSPPIHRRSSNQIKDTPTGESYASAPQGILKKKTELAESVDSDFHTAKTPSVLSEAGDSSSSEDENEMVVDDAFDDVPGRQIRFSVPPKEDLDSSAFSSKSTESPIRGMSFERSDFLKKFEELKPASSLERYGRESKEFLNLSQRRTLLVGLTREPVKKGLPEKSVLSEPRKLTHEKSYPEGTVLSSQHSLSSKICEQVISVDLDSDSCSAQDDEKSMTANDKKISSVSSNFDAPTLSHSIVEPYHLTNLNVQPSPHLSASESPLNRSSSSANSSYNSVASERSFVITPRKPLRENSRNSSFSSTSISVQEGQTDQTLLGDEMVIGVSDSNTNDHSGDDEDICIIGEVSAPLFEKVIESEKRTNEKDSSQTIPASGRSPSMAENTCAENINTACEIEKNNFPNVFHTNEASLDIEQIFDSHAQNSGAEQFNDNQNFIGIAQNFDAYQSRSSCAEQYNNGQHLISYVDQSNDDQTQISYVQQSNDDQSRSSCAEQYNDDQNQISCVEQLNDGQNQISCVEQPNDDQNQIMFVQQSNDDQNQISFIQQSNDGQNQVTYVQQSNDDQSCAQQFNDDHIQISFVQQSDDDQSQVSCVGAEQLKDDQSQISCAKQPDDDQNQISKAEAVTAVSADDQSSTDTEVLSVPHEVVEIEEMTDDVNKDPSPEGKETKVVTEILDIESMEPTESCDASAVETPSEEVKKEELDIANEQFAKSLLGSQECGFDGGSFSKDICSINIPAYVPIKERINRSHQNTSDCNRLHSTQPVEEQSTLVSSESMELGEKLDSSKPLSASESSKKALEKLESITESSADMETNLLLCDKSSDLKSMSPPSFSSKDMTEQKLTEHFDFISKNSDFYENNKLYKEAINLLKADMPQTFEFDRVKKSSRKTRTFVFDMEKKVDTKSAKSKPKESYSKSKGSDSESKDSDSKSLPLKSASTGFLESWHPETYEQFSNSIQKGRADDKQKETLKSSPNVADEKSSISLFRAVDESKQSSVRSKERRKQDSAAKDTSVKQKSPIKKAKSKTKTPKKIDFSFAEPHSPAGPEILEALTTPSEYPVKSFMFSPPLTRGRLRQRKLDESLGSSFTSVASDTSFTRAKKPPVDSILEEIIAAKAPESQTLLTSFSKSKTKSSSKKQTPVKTSVKSDVLPFEIGEKSINLSSLVDTGSPELSTSKMLSSMKNTKHTMVLRQSKTKSRTEQLF